MSKDIKIYQCEYIWCRTSPKESDRINYHKPLTDRWAAIIFVSLPRMVKKPFLLCVRSQSFIPLRISKQAYIKHQCWHVITQPDARAKMISLCMKRSNHDMGSHKGSRNSFKRIIIVEFSMMFFIYSILTALFIRRHIFWWFYA